MVGEIIKTIIVARISYHKDFIKELFKKILPLSRQRERGGRVAFRWDTAQLAMIATVRPRADPYVYLRTINLIILSPWGARTRK